MDSVSRSLRPSTETRETATPSRLRAANVPRSWRLCISHNVSAGAGRWLDDPSIFPFRQLSSYKGLEFRLRRLIASIDDRQPIAADKDQSVVFSPGLDAGNGELDRCIEHADFDGDSPALEFLGPRIFCRLFW